MQIRKTLGVRLTEAEMAALRVLADREDREIRHQAARLIRLALIREGLLPDPEKEGK